MLYGVCAFATSFLILAVQIYPYTIVDISIQEIFNKALFQLRPAIIEEVGFRFGLVLLALHFFGKKAALFAGSVPFGILHLLNFMSGQEIQWDYIFGTSIAGLFLSLVFLNFNLGAVIVTHYIWNVFTSLYAKIFSFDPELLEANPATLIVLIMLSLWLFYREKSLKSP